MTIPRALRERLRAGRVIPFAGAGVSMAVRRDGDGALFPSWRQLLVRGADRLEEEGKPRDATLAIRYEIADLRELLEILRPQLSQ